MMISYLQPLPVGNAVRVLLAPPASAVAWRVLRKAANTFVDQNDVNAGVVYDGFQDTALVDAAALTNGTPYYYKAFYVDAHGAWTGSAVLSATPAATAHLIGDDPLELVRSRLEAGLMAEVAANNLQHTDGYIPCLTAPPLYEGTAFPIVTVHLTSNRRALSGLGETAFPDVQDPVTGLWTELEGWIADVTINVISWVVGNADARIKLRRAIAKVLLANIPVFYAKGLEQVDFTQADIEDTETYSAPMYQTITTVTGQAPMTVDAVSAPIADVTTDNLIAA